MAIMAAPTLSVAERLAGARRHQEHTLGERNRLLALLCTHYPAHIIPVPDSRLDWRQAVCLHLPLGVVAWKLHDDEIALEFSFLPTEAENGCERQNALEKVDRVAHAIEARMGDLTRPVVLKRRSVSK